MTPINQTILAPFDSPTSTPVTAPTFASFQPNAASVGKPTGPCGPGEAEVKLITKTDYWDYETSWQLLTETHIIKSRSTTYDGNHQTYNEDIGCVNKNAVHPFIIQDSYGEGIYSPGGYWLYLDGALVFIENNFQTFSTHAILSNFNLFMLKLNTDNYGGETSWDLKKNGSIVISKGQYTYCSNKTYE